MLRVRKNGKASAEKFKNAFKNTTLKGVQKISYSKVKTFRGKKNGKVPKTKEVENHLSVSKLEEMETDEETHEARALFEKPLVIGDEDHFTRLPFDCFDSIVTLLNHEDLDKLSSVSQSMFVASAYARTRFKKIFAYNISICQRNPCTVKITATFPRGAKKGTTLTLDPSAIDVTPDNGNIAHPNIPDSAWNDRIANFYMPLSDIGPVNSGILDRLIPQLSRFSFDSVTFDSIAITNEFVDDFAIIQTMPLKSIAFRRCVFDENINQESTEGFQSFLIEMAPKSLQLDFPRMNESAIFDAGFIRQYAKAVRYPKLILSEHDLPRDSRLVGRHDGHIIEASYQFKEVTGRLVATIEFTPICDCADDESDFSDCDCLSDCDH